MLNKPTQGRAKVANGWARDVIQYHKTTVQLYFTLSYLTVTNKNVKQRKKKKKKITISKKYFRRTDGRTDILTDGPT